MPARRRLLALAVLALAAGGCGGSSTTGPTFLGAKAPEQHAAQELGFPEFATRNTTRVAGGDAIADAAGVARAVYPSVSPDTRPDAVVLADSGDWTGALAASVLMAPPLRAPILLTQGGDLPPASSDALTALAPQGSTALGGAQIVRIGDVAAPSGQRAIQLKGGDPYTMAAAIDRLATAARGRPTGDVVVAGADQPAFAMPAAAWAAKSGDPLLYVARNGIPAATRRAIASHGHPRIYVIGPASAVPERVATALAKLGRVVRIEGEDPVRNAIAFARYSDGHFGWGITDPGHGLVFAATSDPVVAAAAAPLSASGTYGPLLLVDGAATVPAPLSSYLLDIEPGYRTDPVRGVYNHGWLVGDQQAISTVAQARIDTLLEIAPVSGNGA